ncbi:MAG: CBS domain-containing protein [Fimbriimonadales bacterium]
MRVDEIMTKDLACCTPKTTLPEAARMMAQNDCGALPVVDTPETMQITGIITDRDIACRGMLQERNPLDLKVSDCMTPTVETIRQHADVRDAERLMKEHQVRRIPVVDADAKCCGIVSQADIALNAPDQETAQVLKEVSQPVRQVPAHTSRVT